ncbi:MAG: gamma carbonic anhydrase family protein [Pseudomonadota bacterium]
MTEAHIGPHVTLNNPAFIHPTALIHGKVRIEEGASVWPYVVFRAEMYEVVIGARTNIQDHVMVHVGMQTGTYIGKDCSITHKVCLHGCTLGDRCLVGIGATIMDGAKIGANSIVAGHAIVTENAEFPENSVIAGVPAKQVATRDCGDRNMINARFYLRNAQNFAKGIDRFSEEDMKFMLG